MGVLRASKATTLGYIGKYTSAWSPAAIGGTITTAGGYRIHTYTTVGADTFQVVANISSVDYLFVAGGGGATFTLGGGGGAGGLLTGITSVVNQTYSLSVGGGGAGSTITSARGTNGSNTTGFSLTTVGGGGATGQSVGYPT
jgi:hypothetical protein